MNASTTFSRTMWGLTNINADNITTSSLTTGTLTGSLFKTNLVQSVNDTDSLTLEALTTGKVNLKANGNNIVIVDDAGTNGKTQVNNGFNINNGNLVFSKTSTASQIIDWRTDAGASLGSLFASQLSSAFVFDVNTLTATSFEVRMSGNTRFSITDTIATISSMATFNTTTNTISLNGKVVQNRTDTAISYGTNCISAPTYVAGVSGLLLVGYGNGALRNNTTGNYNTAIGNNALTNVTSGSNNCGFGADAARSVTSGSGHMGIGLQALYSTTTTTDNIGIGTQAGFGYTTGGSNVNIGTRSGIITTTFGGSFSNTSIGNEAGQGLGAFGGNYNTALGHRANYTANTASFSNSTAIGAFSLTTASNQIQLGTATQFVSCGNLSIGKTTVPANKLDVVGNMDVTGIITTPTRPAGTNDTSVATTAFVANYVSGLNTPYTAKYLFDECWDPTYNQCPFGTWDIQGTGGSGVATGNATHPGYYSLTANRAYLSPTVNHYNFRELAFIVRSDNTTNTGDLWCGLCVAYSDYTRGVMFKKTTGTNTFTAVTNGVTKGTFSTITWINGGWFIYKITFANPTVTYTITDLTNNVTESVTDSTNVFDYANTTKSFLQIANGGGTNTAFLDYFSVSYTVPSRA